MRHVIVRERGRLYLGNEGESREGKLDERYLSPVHFQRLYRSDTAPSGKRILHWRPDCALVQQFVGVLQIPGLILEILPKVEGGGADEGVEHARRYLDELLDGAGLASFRLRDMAPTRARRGAIHQRITTLFAKSLAGELRQGTDRQYLADEENSVAWRGKLQVSQHIAKNAGVPTRFFMRREELAADTPLNRVFLAVVRLLCQLKQPREAEVALAEVLSHLEPVTDVPLNALRIDQIQFTRQNERFEPYFELAKLILSGMAPTPEAGNSRSFAMLFDMEKVFELYVGRKVVQAAGRLGDDVRVALQGEGDQRATLRDVNGVLYLRQKPDILAWRGRPGRPGHVSAVFDTKWRKVERDVGTSMERGEVYQMSAYAAHYGASRVGLLYPHGEADPEDEDFAIQGPDGRDRAILAVRFLDVGARLCTAEGREAFISELAGIVAWGLELRTGAEIVPFRQPLPPVLVPKFAYAAAAASMESWQRQGQLPSEDVAEYVDVSGHGFASRQGLFAVEIAGESMNDGKSGLVHGATVVCRSGQYAPEGLVVVVLEGDGGTQVVIKEGRRGVLRSLNRTGGAADIVLATVRARVVGRVVKVIAP